MKLPLLQMMWQQIDSTVSLSVCLSLSFSPFLSLKLTDPLPQNMKSLSIINSPPQAFQRQGPMLPHDSETALTSLFIQAIQTKPTWNTCTWHHTICNNTLGGSFLRFVPELQPFHSKQEKSHHCMCPTTGHVFRHAIKLPHPQPCWIWKA